MAQDLEQLVLTISADVRQMQRALDKIEGDTRKTTRNIENQFDRMGRNIDRTVSRIGAGFRNFGMGILAGAGLASLDNFGRTIRGIVRDAADLVDLSSKVGINTDELQTLSFAFQQAGTDAEAVDKILTQWGKRIGEAYTQGGPLAELFKANGRSLTDNNGQLKASVDLLAEMADMIANAGSEQEQLAIATIAFGKAGADAVVAFKDGAAGIKAQQREAEKLGLVIDKELLERAAELDDRWDAMWASFEARGKSAVLAVLDFMERLRFDFTQLQQAKNAAEAGAVAGSLVGTKLPPGKRSRVRDPITGRINRAFADPPETADPEIVNLLRRRFGESTVVPDFGGGGGGGRSREKDDPWEGLRESAHDYAKELEEINRRQEEMGEIGGNAIGSLVNAFKDGKLEAEELLSIVADLAVQLLRLPGLGGGGIGGGFLSSLLSSIFHEGGVVGQGGPKRSVSPLAFAGAPRMHSGGVAGIRPGEVPAILQRGEVVLPKGSKMSGGSNVHVTVGVDVDRSGNLVPFVTNIAQGEAAAASARVAKGVPKMTDGRNHVRDTRGTRP